VSDANGAPLRVLVVSSLWPPHVLGGAELYAARLASHLESRGYTVGAVTMGVEGPNVVASVAPRPYRLDAFASQPPARRAKFHLLDVYRPGTRRALQAAFERFRPDVVHSHSVQGLSSTALEVPTAAGLPHVHTIHDYWLLCQRASLVRRDGSACAPRCRSCRAISAARTRIIAGSPPDVVLAVSHAIQREHEQIAWVRDRSRVLLNPIAEVDLRSRRPHEGVTFGYLGQLTAAKGVDTLLDAFAAAAIPGSRLLIAGDGPRRGRVEAAVGPSVEYRGWVDDAGKRSFFDDVDVLVVPSEWKDPAPLVINEARARGVPVIGADIGGIAELVGPRSRALLFRSGDAEDLAARLREFATTPAGLDDDLTGTVSWDEHVHAVVGAYRDAIDAHQVGHPVGGRS
jgi:glycogen synthase